MDGLLLAYGRAISVHVHEGYDVRALKNGELVRRRPSWWKVTGGAGGGASFMRLSGAGRSGQLAHCLAMAYLTWPFPG